MKQELLDRINEVFEKQENVNKVYVTSDGNIFTAKHYAENWSCGLSDKNIQEVTRTVSVSQQDEGNDSNESGGNPDQLKQTAEMARKLLDKRYIELFDRKPSHFAKDETVQAQITEKEAELLKNKQLTEQEANNQ